MLIKIILAFFLIYLADFFNLLILNHILLTKSILFLLFIKVLLSFLNRYGKTTFFYFVFVVGVFIGLYWQSNIFFLNYTNFYLSYLVL